MRTGHLSVQQGKRVKVHLRDGSNFVAKFKERSDRVIEFYDHAPINTIKVRTLSISKGVDQLSKEKSDV